MKPLTSPISSSLTTSELHKMANRSYLPTHHRLLPGFSPLTTSRSAIVGASGGRASPPEFAYDPYPRESTRAAGGGGTVRDAPSFGRVPTSPGNSGLSMAYPGVQEFPYGLSGVQMPTYNFGSELYNYVSNGFPRKSRMCSYCNKVFTRSTTRRYHEKRCPLLRASNSLAKHEENNSSAVSTIAAAIKDHQHHQQHQKESSSGSSGDHLPSNKPSPLLPRTLSSSITNTTSVQVGTIPQSSPSLPSLHPAYPTSFPTSSALTAAAAANPSRAVGLYNGYPHSYRSHFYNSISAAALASLDQNSNKQESDNASWGSGSPPPTGKSRERDHDLDRTRRPSDGGSANILGVGSGMPPLTKAFTSEAAVDLTARYCADFSIRARPPVFPTNSLRGHPPSPPSPDVEEVKASSAQPGDSAEQSNGSSPDVVLMSGHPRWPGQSQDKPALPYDHQRSPNSDTGGQRGSSSSPPTGMWESKTGVDPVQGPYMQVAPLDEEDEEDLDEEEDEEEVEEDEEQFKSTSPLSPGGDAEGGSLRHKSTSYNPLVCQFCKKLFSDVITRKAHEALHTQKKSFACALCSHSFHCAYSLRIHTLRHHKQPPYKCKYCLNSYDSPSSLKSHLLKQHSLPESEQQSFKYFSLLTGTASPPLDYMLKTAVSDSEQERYSSGMLPHQHRRSADNLPESLALNDTALKSHTSNEFNDSLVNGKDGGEQDVETETCKICNKAFAKSFIRFHERAHADQKPYECPICNKRFGYKNNMKSHMKLHQGLKPYQCQICGARFTRGSTLRRHGRRHNISRNSMLDFVLYDHSAGPTRAMGVGQKLSLTAPASTLPDGVPQFPHPCQTNQPDTPGKSVVAGSVNHQLSTASNGFDSNRYNANAKRSPSRLSPTQHAATPRGAGNPQSMANSMVGGLAAVAAANLFAYPGTAAPHLYQFYTSTNPLMGYPSYPSATTANQSAPVVQSDALNLSLGKRRSPFAEEEVEKKKSLNAMPRLESVIVSGDNGISQNHHHHHQRHVEEKLTKVKVEVEEVGEVPKVKNPFTPYSNPVKDFQGRPLDKDRPFVETKEEHLKISTEDFAAQVNICCPSPQVQSSASSVHHGSTGSPVGSSLGPDGPHNQAEVSPNTTSQASSPVNLVPSPSGLSESHLQNLLVSLITSGRMFRCSFCDIYFTEYAMFRLHQKYHQCDMARPFLCAVCGEDCKDKTYFTVHLSEHLGLGTKTGLP